MDHSKAFYTVDHEILLKKVQTHFHFSNTACGLIRSYLMNRSQSVYLNGYISNSLNVGRGIPQGSILGPLLFCKYINDLPVVLDNCSLHMYADDVQLYRSICIENIRLCIDSVNDDLRKIDNWANGNGLCINSFQFKYLLLSRIKKEFDVSDIIRGIKLILMNQYLIWVLSLMANVV